MIRTLTEKWKRRIHSTSSTSSFGRIHLMCRQLLIPCPIRPRSVDASNIWVGSAHINGYQKSGGYRKSEDKAKKDAERLAVELLRDIRDGAKALMDEYDMGEDD